MSTREDFRPEIEGVRALAVGAVLLHHAFPAMLPGGFAGVDIFFVVSGYVIGRGLISAFGRGDFRFSTFWARRARRLFPALALVLLVIWSLGSLLLVPSEFASLGRQMLAAALFGNNVLLVGESGYFDPAASSHPLLHLWSLGVEEQFYLLAPCLLWLGVASGGRPMIWVYRACAVSLVWTVVFARLDEASSFYLLHTRFWELGAGLVLAHLHSKPAATPGGAAREAPLAGPGPREIQCWLLALVFAAILQILYEVRGTGMSAYISFAGLVVLLCAALLALYAMEPGARLPWVAAAARLRQLAGLLGLVVLCLTCSLASSDAWPGAQTIWPVLGTLLIVNGRATGWVGALLTSRPSIYLGRISYPLYLWHWPLLVYLRILRPEPSMPELAAVLLSSVVLAHLTERWVERPLRFGQWGLKRMHRPGVGWAALAMGVVGVLGFATELGKGLASRAPEGAKELAQWAAPGVWKQYRAGECFHFLGQQTQFDPVCTPARVAGRPLVLLWGDSHAAHLYPGIGPWAKSRGVDLAQWTTGSCPPTWLRLSAEGTACPVKAALAQEMVLSQRPDLVILSAAWGLYLAGDAESRIVLAVADAADRLRGMGIREIVIFGPGPRWNTSLPADLYRHMLRQRDRSLPSRLKVVDARLLALDAAMMATAHQKGLRYVSVLQNLCNADGCLTVANPAASRPDLTYWDRDHLTVSGSTLLVDKVASSLDAGLGRLPP